ncbi:unnamed protein product [Paramecium octaurelia]|uniref:Uncharacterized protein n=1 Tax=Paramecium octaurelia TaxID=43137 RepID=A0A8S1Y6X4_PAROT|nr:unnamed protein product [Paramecium octaurelia]
MQDQYIESPFQKSQVVEDTKINMSGKFSGTVKSRNCLIKYYESKNILSGVLFVVQSYFTQILFDKIESLGQLKVHLLSDVFLYPFQQIEHSQSLSHFKQYAGHQAVPRLVQIIYHPELEFLQSIIIYLRKISFERKIKISLIYIKICHSGYDAIFQAQRYKLSVQKLAPSQQNEEQYVELIYIEIPELIGVALQNNKQIYALRGYKNQYVLIVIEAPSLFLKIPKQGPSFLLLLLKFAGSQIMFHEFVTAQLEPLIVNYNRYRISKNLQYLSLLSVIPNKQQFKHLQYEGGSPDKTVLMGHRHIPLIKVVGEKHDVHQSQLLPEQVQQVG